MSETIGFIGLGHLGMRSAYITALRAKQNRWCLRARTLRANPLTL
jgi:hypothetical protein